MVSNINIDALIADLTPVRRVGHGDVLLIAIAATFVPIVSIIMTIGIRSDILTNHINPVFFIRSGLLLMLAIATIFAISGAARPVVGNAQNNWVWALSIVSVFPIVGFYRFLDFKFSGNSLAPLLHEFKYGPICLFVSMLSALWIGGILTLWLRRGAPTALHRAGWLVGIAAGALGVFSFNFHCSSSDIIYIGFWYSLSITFCACLGRILVPRLIRW